MEKRDKILEASIDFFGKYGYKKATIKTIADKVGVAPGTIYTYFKDKDELFISTIMEIWDVLINKIHEVLKNPSKSFKSRYLEVYTLAESLILKSHSLLLGMFSVSSRRKMLRDNLDRLCMALQPLFKEGSEAGFNMPHAEGEHALFQIRIILSGILFELSLVESKDLPEALKKIKKAAEAEFLRSATKERA